MSRYGRPLALEEISPEYLRNREAALNQCGTPAVNHDPLVFCGVRQRVVHEGHSGECHEPPAGASTCATSFPRA